ncbi:MAG: hypothetical protein V4516_00220, partial [Pseudomonadota bacterium]
MSRITDYFCQLSSGQRQAIRKKVVTSGRRLRRRSILYPILRWPMPYISNGKRLAGRGNAERRPWSTAAIAEAGVGDFPASPPAPPKALQTSGADVPLPPTQPIALLNCGPMGGVALTPAVLANCGSIPFCPTMINFPITGLRHSGVSRPTEENKIMKYQSLAAALTAALVLGSGAAWAGDVPLNDPAKEAEIRKVMAERGFEEVRSVGTIDGKF